MDSKKVSFRGLFGNKNIDSNSDGLLQEVSGLAPNGPVESPRWEVYNTGNSVPKNYTAGSFTKVAIINEFWHDRSSYGNDASQAVDLKRWLVFLQDKTASNGDYYLYGTSYNGTSWVLNSTPILQVANADWNSNYEVLFSTINDYDVAVLFTDNAGDAALYYLYDDTLYPSNIFPYVNQWYFDDLTKQDWVNTELASVYPDGFPGIVVDEDPRYIAFLLAYEALNGELIKETQPLILKLDTTLRSVIDSSSSTTTVDFLSESFLVTSPTETQNVYLGNFSEYVGVYNTEWTLNYTFTTTSTLQSGIIARIVKYDDATYPSGPQTSADTFTTVKEFLLVPAGTANDTSFEDIRILFNGTLERGEAIRLMLFRDDMPSEVIADHADFGLVFTNRILTANEPLLTTYRDIVLKKVAVSDSNIESELSTFVSDSLKFDSGQEYSQFSQDDLGEPKVFMSLPQDTPEKCLNEVYYEVGSIEDGEFIFSIKEDDIATGRVLSIESESHHRLSGNNIRTYGKNPVLVQQVRDYVLPGIEWWAVKDGISASTLTAESNRYGKMFTGFSNSFDSILIEVDIDTTKGTFTRQNTIKLPVISAAGSGTNLIPDLLSYPDRNAKRVRLYKDSQLISQYELEPSLSLNMAFNYVESRGDQSASGASPSNSSVNQSLLTEHNKIRLASSDERFFPLVNTYDDFTGDVLSIVDNSNETSEGQFGQYPLYVLTKSTIYAGAPGQDTLFSRFVVITDDTGVKSKQAFCTYKGQLFFVSDNGLHSIVGSRIQEIDYSLEELDTYETFLESEEFFVTFNISTREILFASDTRIIFIYNEKYNLWYSIDSATLWTTVDQRNSLKRLFEINGQAYILTNGFISDTYDPSFLIEWRKGINTNSLRVKFRTHPIVLSDFTLYKRLKKAIWEANLIVDTPSFIEFLGYRTSSDDIDKEYELLTYFVNVASIELDNISGSFIVGEKVVLGTTNVKGTVIDFASPIVEVNISKNIVDIQGQVLFGEKSRATGTIISDGITYVERQSTLKNLLFKSNYGSMQAFSINADITVKDRGYLSDLLFEYENRQRVIKGPSLRLDDVIPPLADNLTATLSGISSVTLNWQDKTNEESGFQIERSLLPTEDFQLVTIVGSDVTEFEDTTVVNGETYYYRVRPLGVNSLYSNVATIDVPEVFTTTWNTNNISTGSTSNNQIQLPLVGANNFIVDWGDGTLETVTTTGAKTHTYSSVGIYTIQIVGTISGWSFNNTGDRLKITELSNWAGWRSGNSSGCFYGCSNLNVTSSDSPYLTGVTTLENWFRNCTNLVATSSFNNWDTQSIESLRSCFEGCTLFNQSLNSWDTSSVTIFNSCFKNTGYNSNISDWTTSSGTDFAQLFRSNTSFNQNISGWNMSSATNITQMFEGCSSFNQSLDSWNISNCQIFDSAFRNCIIYDQPMNSWVTSSATSFRQTFEGCSAFNQNLNSWDVSSVTVMNSMFKNASNFNGNITAWNVTSVTDMAQTFSGASDFNQAIGVWTTSALRFTIQTFLNCSSFNQALNNWDVSDVIQANQMFKGCSLFNQPLNTWSTSLITTMEQMFEDCTVFNQDISGWNVSSVTNMGSMFRNASAFEQDLGGWDITSLTSALTMFFGVTLSVSNYDSLLIGWESNTRNNDVSFGGGNSQYTLGGAAETARNALIADGWDITDAGGV